MRSAPIDRLRRLLEALTSEKPAPASGSAAAAVVAVAAALLEKAAKISAGHWSGAEDALVQAHTIRLRSEELIEHDLHAYLAFVDAMRSARDLQGEAHEQAVGSARERTVEVPLLIVGAASQAVELAEQLAERGNPALRADAVVAAILASAAAESAATLVAVNLNATTDDIRIAEAQMLARGAYARARSLSPADS